MVKVKDDAENALQCRRQVYERFMDSTVTKVVFWYFKIDLFVV